MKMTNKIDADYLRLINQVPLLPIETEQANQKARELLSELIDREDRDENLSATEVGYARVLKKLIQDYSNFKCQGLVREQSLGSDILQSLMDDYGLTQTDIAELTRMQKQNVNAYLKNKRALPREAREILGKRFKVNPEIFTFRVAGIDTFPDPDEEDQFFKDMKHRRR